MDVLHPKGDLDVLSYYSKVAPSLKKFLKGKTLAAKNWIPGMSFNILKRGSKQKPLYIEDLIDAVDDDFLELRKMHLKEARSQLSEKQALVWEYFIPRKLSDFFYATNGEGAGKPIERVFYDLDRGEGITSKQAQQAALHFCNSIRDDKDFQLKHDLLACWTGNSFHIFLLLKKPIDASDYAKFFQYSEKNPAATFTGKWAAEVQKSVSFKVEGGHEKKAKTITFDPSQTPSGKLCRSPFSLHMKDANTVDGVDVPLTVKMLEEKDLVTDLRTYDANRVTAELNDLAKRVKF
jgi:DNA primase